MAIAVIVVAAGRGVRLGADRPKALVPLVGQALITHALRRVVGTAGLGRIVIVHPEGVADDFREALAPIPTTIPLVLVPGGATRSDSVRAGLAATGPEDEIVLVHDAARCLAPASLFEAVAAAVAAGHRAVVPGMPVVDTIKLVDEAGDVVATPDRGRLRAVQTPQGFDRATLLAAHQSAERATDDAALVETMGVPVRIIPGDPRALKVTGPDDLLRVQAMVNDIPDQEDPSGH